MHKRAHTHASQRVTDGPFSQSRCSFGSVQPSVRVGRTIKQSLPPPLSLPLGVSLYVAVSKPFEPEYWTEEMFGWQRQISNIQISSIFILCSWSIWIDFLISAYGGESCCIYSLTRKTTYRTNHQKLFEVKISSAPASFTSFKNRASNWQ